MTRTRIAPAYADRCRRQLFHDWDAQGRTFL